MTHFIAETDRDIADADQVLSMSGLDFLQGIIDGKIPPAPIYRPLNFDLERVETGCAVFRGTPRTDVLNPSGNVHGGWYGTILDSAMGCAVHSELPAGTIYTTLEFKVNITRAIPLGTEVIAEGRTAHVGRSTGVASGEIRGAEDGRLYATGSTTCIILQTG